MNKVFFGVFIGIVSHASFAESGNDYKWRSPVHPITGDYIERKNADETGVGRKGNIYDDRKKEQYRKSDPNLNGRVQRESQSEYQGSLGYGGRGVVAK